jgi:hypothetical protein
MRLPLAHPCLPFQGAVHITAIGFRAQEVERELYFLFGFFSEHLAIIIDFGSHIYQARRTLRRSPAATARRKMT